MLLRDAVSGSLRALSVLPAELPDAIRRLQADGKTLRKRASDLQVALAGQEAERLLALAARNEAAALSPPCSMGWEAAGLRAVASSLIARGPVQVVLATSEPPVSIVVAQSSANGADAAVRGGAPDRAFGGRGGGNASWRRPGGSSESRQAIVDAAATRARGAAGAGSRKPEAGSPTAGG